MTGTMTRTRPALPVADLDRTWAEVLGCEPADLRAGRPLLIPGSPGAVQVFLTADGGVIIAPPPVLELATDLHLDHLLDREIWAARLQLRPDRLATYSTTISYATRELFREHSHPFVRRLKRYDAEALVRFARILDTSENGRARHWEVGGRSLGVPGTHLWGAYFEGRLVSVAGVRGLSREIAEVGVDTLPKYRGQGYGTAVASGATRAALTMVPLVQWSSDFGNIASGRIATHLGYRTYAHQLWLSLPTR